MTPALPESSGYPLGPVAWRGAVLLILLVAMLLLWGGLARIHSGVVVPGEIAVAGPLPGLQHLRGGTVVALAVAEGDRVAAGGLLLRLDSGGQQAERSILAGRMTMLLATRAVLVAERDGTAQVPLAPFAAPGADPALIELIANQRALLQARRSALTEEERQRDLLIGQITDQIAGIAARLVALRGQAELNALDLADRRLLFDRGLSESGPLRALEREGLALSGEIAALEASRAEAEGRIAAIRQEAEARHAQRMASLAEDIGMQSQSLVELAERVALLDSQIAEAEVRAPVAGRVHDLRVSGIGAVIRPAELMMQIIPENADLVIAARIPAAQIEQIRPGQAVLLVLSGPARGLDPPRRGVLVSLSATTLPGPAGSSDYYRAEVRLSDGAGPTSLATPDGGQGLTVLRPGMPVEVRIATGSHAPLDYLLAPFVAPLVASDGFSGGGGIRAGQL